MMVELVKTTVTEESTPTVTNYYVTDKGFYLVERYRNYSSITYSRKGKLRGLNEYYGFRGVAECDQSPITVPEHERYHNEYLVCPFCGHVDHDYYDVINDDYEGETECRACEKPFAYKVKFLRGIDCSPIDCGNGHHYVFAEQYYYGKEVGHEGDDGHNVRIMQCIYCDDYTYDRLPWNMLPWLDEYNDPEYFDPEGILATPPGYDRDKPTPVLDLMANRAQSTNSHYIKSALKMHDEYYSKPEDRDYPIITFSEFNSRRQQRGAEAARFDIEYEDGEKDWLWMSSRDIRKNIDRFPNSKDELLKGLSFYE
jgi:transcription elongation factor Elf1